MKCWTHENPREYHLSNFQILSNSADFNNLSTKENLWKRKEKKKSKFLENSEPDQRLWFRQYLKSSS